MPAHRKRTGPEQVKALVVSVRGFIEGTRIRAAWMEPACYVLFGSFFMAVATQAHVLLAAGPLLGIAVLCGIGRHLETLEWQEQLVRIDDEGEQLLLLEWQEYLDQGEDACDPFDVGGPAAAAPTTRPQASADEAALLGWHDAREHSLAHADPERQ